MVELMVVIGIIGLLTLFAIPVFQDAGRGGRLRTAIFQVNANLSLARQNAITSRQRVVMLLPDDAPDLDASKAFRQYALYGNRDGYMTDWLELPQGIVFDPDVAATAGELPRNIFTLQHGGAGGNEIFLADEVHFPNNDGPQRELFALGFRPDGRIFVGGVVNPTLYLAEGWTEYDPDSGVFDNIFVHEDLPLRGITVNALTGQSIIREFQRNND